MNRKEELIEKIKKIKDKISFEKNSCVGLQREEFESFSNERMYLEILEKELKNLDSLGSYFFFNIFCELKERAFGALFFLKFFLNFINKI